MREIAHLRPRTNINSCITRIRGGLSQAIHHYFQNLNFISVNTPIITQLDCENSKELFQITTLTEKERIKWIKINNELDIVDETTCFKISLFDSDDFQNLEKIKSGSIDNFEGEQV